MKSTINSFAVVFVIICLLSVVSVIRAGIVRVPSDQPTIQAGLNVADLGDTVLVAPGVYIGDGNRDIGFGMKVLMSEEGPEVTIIDCQGSETDPHRGFYFGGNQEEDTVVDGFTIINGYTVSGGGGAIYCSYSGPTIRNNIIKGNTTLAKGGGICCWYSSLDAAPIIVDNTIVDNFAMSGGGISCWEGLNEHYPTIVGNTIARNTGNNSGGGIYVNNETSPVIDNNTIYGNYAGYYGGGALYVGSGCFPTVTSCIFWNDSAYDVGQEILVRDGGSVTVSYSDVEGGWTGTGNIEDDPDFLLTDKDDYRLLWDSPCIDTGKQGSFDPDLTRRDMGAWYFDQSEYLTIYVTPDSYEAQCGNQFGVTYTFINRSPWTEQFWLLTQVILPNGKSLDVLGPEQKSLAAWATSQVYETHFIPSAAPTMYYKYFARVGVPPSTLYGDDSFMFRIVP
jgi:parallel beta-helix repeat protein